MDVDIRHPLPFADDSVDYILAEHVFEHVTPHEGIGFLKECFRVLKSTGVLRLCVPVIDYIIQRHDEPYLRCHGGSLHSAIEMMAHSWGHQALYTEQMLLLLLDVFGFECQVKSPMQSDYAALQGVDGHPRAIGAQMNWIETAVIEAVKRKPRIFDCFTFLNEDALVEIRLHELKDVVDYFVVVESNRTFTGNPKPLNFDINRAELAEFKDRIIYVTVEDMPREGAWQAEAHQRNCCLRGLAKAKPGDIIMLSDVDEIPRANVVREQAEAVSRGDKPSSRLVLNCHYFYLNSVPGAPWVYGPVMTDFDSFLKMTPEEWRHAKVDEVYDSGWHFSYFGGKERIVYKIESFSHTEFNNEDGKRFWLESADATKTVDVMEEYYPHHVRANPDRFAEYLR